MCGIIGFSSFDKNKYFNSKNIKDLFIFNSTRGLDGSGYYSPINGLNKKAGSILENISGFNIKKDNILIGHVRKSSAIFSNIVDDSVCHPLEKNNCVLAHNGYVKNYSTLINSDFYDDNTVTYNNVKPDSLIIALLFDKYKLAKEVIPKLEGIINIILIDKTKPDHIYVYKHPDRTLFYGLKKEGMYISSIKESLEYIGCKTIKEFEDYNFYVIKNGQITKNYLIKNKIYNYYSQNNLHDSTNSKSKNNTPQERTLIHTASSYISEGKLCERNSTTLKKWFFDFKKLNYNTDLHYKDLNFYLSPVYGKIYNLVLIPFSGIKLKFLNNIVLEKSQKGNSKLKLDNTRLSKGFVEFLNPCKDPTIFTQTFFEKHTDSNVQVYLDIVNPIFNLYDYSKNEYIKENEKFVIVNKYYKNELCNLKKSYLYTENSIFMKLTEFNNLLNFISNFKDSNKKDPTKKDLIEHLKTFNEDYTFYRASLNLFRKDYSNHEKTDYNILGYSQKSLFEIFRSHSEINIKDFDHILLFPKLVKVNMEIKENYKKTLNKDFLSTIKIENIIIQSDKVHDEYYVYLKSFLEDIIDIEFIEIDNKKHYKNLLDTNLNKSFLNENAKYFDINIPENNTSKEIIILPEKLTEYLTVIDIYNRKKYKVLKKEWEDENEYFKTLVDYETNENCYSSSSNNICFKDFFVLESENQNIDFNKNLQVDNDLNLYDDYEETDNDNDFENTEDDDQYEKLDEILDEDISEEIQTIIENYEKQIKLLDTALLYEKNDLYNKSKKEELIRDAVNLNIENDKLLQNLFTEDFILNISENVEKFNDNHTI